MERDRQSLISEHLKTIDEQKRAIVTIGKVIESIESSRQHIHPSAIRELDQIITEWCLGKSSANTIRAKCLTP